jgi:uncharacterized membrane protein YozB (DUF420 family)
MAAKEKKTPGFVMALISALVFVTLGIAVFGMLAKWQERQGFILLHSYLLPDINLIGQFVALLGMSVAVILVKLKNTPAHRYGMIACVLVNLALTVSMMMERFVGFIRLGITHGLLGTLFLVHGIVGILAVLAGVYLILRMTVTLPKFLRLKRWKLMMLLTFLLYWLVGLVGFYIYLVLYRY